MPSLYPHPHITPSHTLTLTTSHTLTFTNSCPHTHLHTLTLTLILKHTQTHSHTLTLTDLRTSLVVGQLLYNGTGTHPPHTHRYPPQKYVRYTRDAHTHTRTHTHAHTRTHVHTHTQAIVFTAMSQCTDIDQLWGVVCCCCHSLTTAKDISLAYLFLFSLE